METLVVGVWVRHERGLNSPGGEANGSIGIEEVLMQKVLGWNQFKAKRD